TGAISAITGIIGIFQNMHQETSLNAIEHNTRYSMEYLGERSDGGIMTASLKSLEKLGYAVADLDDIKSHLWTMTDAWKPGGTAIEALTTLKDRSYWELQDLDNIKNTLFTLNGKTATGGSGDMAGVILGLDNINNTLQYSVGLNPWFQ